MAASWCFPEDSSAHPAPPGVSREALQSTPAFFGCSDIDAHVPEARVRESAAVYERMGAEVTTRIYPGMGHLVNEEEVSFARDLLSRLAS